MRTTIRSAIKTLPGGGQLLALYQRYRLAPRLAHRGAVGGRWHRIGQAQFDFMVRQGLRPEDVLLDIGCGSLRGGRLFIDYLEPEHYLGLDRHAWLIEAGLRYEVPTRVKREKRPQFVVSDRFEFEKFGRRPTFALAQSLFSHLTKPDIHLCLTNLRSVMGEGDRFFATFIRAGSIGETHGNPEESDDVKPFQYEPDEILEIGRETGWQGTYLGDWGHPRGQEMLEFIAPGAAPRAVNATSRAV